MDKGATRIDKAAHSLVEFYEQIKKSDLHGITRLGDYIAFYHESRLYTVYNMGNKHITIVEAISPYDAIEKVMGEQTVINQYGKENYNITNVGTIKL